MNSGRVWTCRGCGNRVEQRHFPGSCACGSVCWSPKTSTDPDVTVDTPAINAPTAFVDGVSDGRHLVDALHPNGRCTCWGEGRCALCKQWAREDHDGASD